jgi:alpha-glucosidase
MVMGGGDHAPGSDVVELGPMFDQEGVHDIYRSWNRLLATYPGDRVMVGEACVEPAERAARYVRPDEMQQAFNFPFLQCRWDAAALRRVITVSREADGAVGAPTTWVLSNHDVVRHASLLGLPDTGRSPNGIGVDDPQPDAALGLRRARAAALLMLALPGSAYLYQGEELGLPEHTTLPDEVRQDPIWFRSGGAERGRDGCRVPLPWHRDRPGFGFGPTGRTWLPQPPEWADLAADVQRRDPRSTLSLYRTALGLREKLGLGAGDLSWTAVDGADPGRVLAFRNGTTLVVVNLGDEPIRLPGDATVVLRSTAGINGDAVVGPDETVWTSW